MVQKRVATIVGFIIIGIFFVAAPSAHAVIVDIGISEHRFLMAAL